MYALQQGQKHRKGGAFKTELARTMPIFQQHEADVGRRDAVKGSSDREKVDREFHRLGLRYF